MRIVKGFAIGVVGAVAVLGLAGCTQPLPNGTVTAVGITERGDLMNPSWGRLCVKPDFPSDVKPDPAWIKGGMSDGVQIWCGEGCEESKGCADRPAPVPFRAIKECRVGWHFGGDTCTKPK